jgi:ubiquitin-protein ligase
MATGGSSGTAPTRQTTRIQDDLKALKPDLLESIKDLQLGLVGNLNELTGVMIGPKNSDYEGGRFLFGIKFPAEYPFKPPEFFFRTKIIHPNVDFGTGLACQDQLMATWAPNIKLNQYLTEMYSLLSQPNYDTPIEGDSTVEKNPQKARELIKDQTKPSNQ